MYFFRILVSTHITKVYFDCNAERFIYQNDEKEKKRNDETTIYNFAFGCSGYLSRLIAAFCLSIFSSTHFTSVRCK